MRRELRVARLLIGWQFMLLLGLFVALLVLMHDSYWHRVEGLIPVVVVLALQQLTHRIVQVGQADIWRLLPGGFTVLMRAMALLMLGLGLLVSSLWTWSNGSLSLNSMPFARTVLCFVYLSLLALMIISAILLQRGGLFIAFGAVGSGLAIAALFQGFPVPHLWWVATAMIAVAWLVVCFAKLPPPTRISRARAERLAGTGSSNLSATLRGWMLRINPPDRSLLKLESRRAERLGIAVLVIVGWALMQHLVLGHRTPVDTYRVGGSLAILMTLILVCAMAASSAVRARPLWLRLGDGRGAVFRAVERSLLIDLAILSGVCWFTFTLLARSRGVQIDAAPALLMLVLCSASALAPLYITLFGATLHGWVQQVPLALVAVAAIALSPAMWSAALGIGNHRLLPRYPEEVLGLLALAVALRFIAAWRWRRVDWAYFRARPQPQSLRRAVQN